MTYRNIGRSVVVLVAAIVVSSCASAPGGAPGRAREAAGKAFGGGDSGSTSTAHAATGTRPSWMDQYPVDPDYYVGIGGNPDTGDRSGDMEKARMKALSQLASEISVTVQSATAIREQETSKGDHSVSAETIVKTLTDQKLEGVELVDSWSSTKDGYWFYYRLSKQKWDLIVNRDAYALRDRVLGMVTSLDGSSATVLERLGTLSEALRVVQESPYAGKITTRIDEASGVLDDLLVAKIQRVLDDLSLDVATPDVSTGPGHRGTVTVKVTSRKGTTVGVMPLAVTTTSGAVAAGMTTDASGAYTGVPPFTGLTLGSQAVRVSISRAVLGSARVPSSVATPAAAMTVNVLPLEVAMNIVQRSDSKTPGVEDGISAFLLQKYALGIVTGGAPAVTVSGTVDFRDVPKNDMGFVFSYCTVSITVTQGGRQVVAYKMPEVKGTGLSLEQARQLATRGMLDKLKKDAGFDSLMTSFLA